MLRRTDEVEGVQVLEAKSFPDERGFLLQSFIRSDLERRGIPGTFAQAIQSKSARGVVRGLHFQWNPPQGKLVRCVSGIVFDVVVDLRLGSPTLGDHIVAELSDQNHRMIWVPPGFAHGFMALQDRSIVLYCCTAEWNPNGEGGIRWNDPALGIGWPDLPPCVSPKDLASPTFGEWLRDPRSANFRYPV
jgi:dTDP-4-dehydrorhamnose 3,5-epimerase